MRSHVLRVPSHQVFGIQSAVQFERDVSLEGSVEVTPEQLLGPLALPHSSEPRQELKQAYTNCLTALLDLAPFNAIVSLRATFDDEPPAKRDWCQIYYQGRTVASFTHSKGLQPKPHVFLTEWPSDSLETEVEPWSVRRWRGFFFSQITYRACALRAGAQEQIAQSQVDLDFGGEVTKQLMAAA